jgi:hypothetical protein
MGTCISRRTPPVTNRTCLRMAPSLSPMLFLFALLSGTSGQDTNCTCSVDPVSVVRLPARPVPTASRQATRFLFLLGYPHMGTSALQFLLSTSASVSGILGNHSQLGPQKEGMAHFEGGRPRGRWNADFPQRWEREFATEAETLYLEKTLPGKLLIESSPPEIYLPHQLNSTFSKHGKVRFILLVHGICGKEFCDVGACSGIEQRMNITLNENNRKIASWAMALHTFHGIITDFGEDVHVIRYEDMCLRSGRVLRDLAAWEPRLADINISRSPPAKKGHNDPHHSATSIADYCDVARPLWRVPKPALCTATPPVLPTIRSSCASMAAKLGYIYQPGQFDCNARLETM